MRVFARSSDIVRRDLPNLLSLRAFECAARHLSFTVAADELCVTQSAVSRHVKNLESHYGMRLFNRLTREIELTEAGLRLFRTVEKSFNAIEAASRELAPRDVKRSLVVSILPTLASTWLMPRLAKFTQSHQNVEVRLHTSIAPVSFERDGIDIAIRVGKPPAQRRRKGAPRVDLVMTVDWKGVSTDRLFADVLVPVCRPALLGRKTAIDALALQRLPLIHTDSRAHAWEDWFGTQGVDYQAGVRDLHFGHFFMSVRAALDGRGVALVPDVVVEDQLRSGELVVASPVRVASAGDYHLIYRRERIDEPAIAAFREWIMAESAAVLAAQGLSD
ncbi:LysR family transcriptional regulator [Pandoraea pnomenusa]|uniref:LysR substrate-binding domain-containing protein n=1 Tax=Pandoraea pnomenusa TaxID=93220 RepID=UPI0011982F73|nr:LysR substrate-binding domain-containing protein [Pandoraea pnomenusa]QDX20872.1 LysR family transcriptional regulator [Pandoraea pnomenusa]